MDNKRLQDVFRRLGVHPLGAKKPADSESKLLNVLRRFLGKKISPVEKEKEISEFFDEGPI